jgi:HSP20 family protein
MALVPWRSTMPWRPFQQTVSPFEGLSALRSEMDRLFETFLGDMGDGGARESLWAPRVDLLEHDTEFILQADLPGMQQEDMDISVQENILTLQGKRSGEHAAHNGNGGYQYRERVFGTFCRRFALGVPVEADKITATYKAGVLEVHIPKAAIAQPKRIPVQATA